jgi:AcrR family transcriptional regulator
MRKLHMPFIQITHAAMNLYAAEGPKGLTMRRVAAAIGVTAPALYRHFRNKDALVEAVAGEAELQLGRCLEAPRRPRPRGNAAVAMVERALQFSIDHRHLFQLVSRRRRKVPGQPSPRSRVAIMRHEVVTAMERGQLAPTDPDRVTAALWAQMCGLVALRERGDMPLEDKPLREAWMALGERLYGGIQKRTTRSSGVFAPSTRSSPAAFSQTPELASEIRHFSQETATGTWPEASSSLTETRLRPSQSPEPLGQDARSSIRAASSAVEEAG